MIFLSLGYSPSLVQGMVRVATYNVENYLLMDRLVEGGWRPRYPKPEAEKAALRRVIHDVRPDILALQEMGKKPFLLELQRDLSREGLDYPYAALLEADDDVRHLALLSKLPFREVIEHTDPDFPYFGEREKIRRGLMEVVYETEGVEWGLFIVHLKSKWTERTDDPESERRRVGEATAARNRILQHYNPDAGEYFLIVGDFNDTRGNATMRRFFRRGEMTISLELPAKDSRGERWTHHWERQDLYSRIDFILASPAMFFFVVEDSATIYDGKAFRSASDHRMVWADFDFSRRAVGLDFER